MESRAFNHLLNLETAMLETLEIFSLITAFFRGVACWFCGTIFR
jgi:hypothetical protein